jgi:hypothetical protein
MKSGNFNYLEPSGQLKACKGTASPSLITIYYLGDQIKNEIGGLGGKYGRQEACIQGFGKELGDRRRAYRVLVGSWETGGVHTGFW